MLQAYSQDPFSLYGLIRLTIKDSTEAEQALTKTGHARPGQNETVCCSECEYGASVVRAEEWQEESQNPLYSTRRGKLTAD